MTDISINIIHIAVIAPLFFLLSIQKIRCANWVGVFLVMLALGIIGYHSYRIHEKNLIEQAITASLEEPATTSSPTTTACCCSPTAAAGVSDLVTPSPRASSSESEPSPMPPPVPLSVVTVVAAPPDPGSADSAAAAAASNPPSNSSS